MSDLVECLNALWARGLPDDVRKLGLEAAIRIAELDKDALEKIAAFMIRVGLATGHGDTIDSLLTEAEWQIERLNNQLTEARKREIKVRWEGRKAYVGRLFIFSIVVEADRWYVNPSVSFLVPPHTWGGYKTDKEARAAVEAAAIAALTEWEDDSNG